MPYATLTGQHHKSPAKRHKIASTSYHDRSEHRNTQRRLVSRLLLWRLPKRHTSHTRVAYIFYIKYNVKFYCIYIQKVSRLKVRLFIYRGVVFDFSSYNLIISNRKIDTISKRRLNRYRPQTTIITENFQEILFGT